MHGVDTRHLTLLYDVSFVSRYVTATKCFCRFSDKILAAAVPGFADWEGRHWGDHL